MALRGTGQNQVTVKLTPYNPPIIIPESGGSFYFNIAIRNLTLEPHTVDLWTQIELPGSGTVPVMNAPNLTLPGGAIVNRDRTQYVPEHAPAGTYTYYAYVGEYPWVINHEDSFTFEKEGGDGGYLGSPSDWLCTGESFDEIGGGSSEGVPSGHPALPEKYAVYGAYPNPFNPTTTIRFDLPEACVVKLEVFDIYGRRVGVGLAPTRQYPPGTHEITFDGVGLSSGIYFYRIEAGEYIASGKMVLMK